MPLLHTASTREFRKILASGKIEAQKECPVFHEKLVYLFYGRPAYKVKVNNPEQRITDEYLPAALVINPMAVSSIKRVHPFDTGAFDNKEYQGSLHKDATLADFELQPSLASAQKLVKTFFGTNERYLLGEALSGAKPNPFDEPEVAAHFALIDGNTKIDVDDRRYSIEIQTSSQVDLSAGLLALVMPHTWLRSATIQNFLKRNPSAAPLTYARFRGMSVAASHAVIFEKVREHLYATKVI